MEYKTNKFRGTDEPFLRLMEIGGAAVLKLFGVPEEEAKNYHFRAIVLKDKRMEPDLEGIPILEGQGRKIYLEFQGYQDTFIRHKLVSKVMVGCAHDNYNGEVLAGIVYTDIECQQAALPISLFNRVGTLAQTGCISEIVLTNYKENELKKIDPQLVVLAPFTISAKIDRMELLQLGKGWKKEVEQYYPEELQKSALDVIGLFVMNRFRNINLNEVIAMLGFDLRETTAGQEIFGLGIEKGIEKGIESLRRVVIMTLGEHFGYVPQNVIGEIQAIDQDEILEELAKSALRSENIEQFYQMLIQNNTTEIR